MPATALAAMASFKVVLFGETSVSLRSEIIISLFKFDLFIVKTHIAKLQILALKP